MKQSNEQGRQNYLHILQKVWQAYGQERIERRLAVDGSGAMDLHSYSRVLTVLSCLIHGGRMKEQTELWKRIMTECCNEIAAKPGRDIADFAIKEVMFSLKMMKETLPDWTEASKGWHQKLRSIDPYAHYGSVWRDGTDPSRLHNINIYNMTGEYLRETEGLTDTGAYFAKHWPVQLQRFDENGMYRDPGCPVLYDLTTRCQIQLMLGFGYDGPFAAELDQCLRQAGLATLRMQSVAGEFAYGGRSNQFLFNEALIAANAEYEAGRYSREGNLALAGAFRQSARLAMESIEPWLAMQPPRHLKNKYDIETKYGTEEYGYYDKYMITLGAFLAIGYWFADDCIPEADCPALTGGYVWQTSPSFHKIFANAGGYSIQIDTSADLNYDATGLGRIHRRGVPTETGLSAPLSRGDKYRLHEGVQRMNAAIGIGWRDRQSGIVRYMAEYDSFDVGLNIVESLPERVQFIVTYAGEELPGGMLEERYLLTNEGITIDYSLRQAEGEAIYIRLPIFATNGLDRSLIQVTEYGVKVSTNGNKYVIHMPGGTPFQLSDIRYGNRNGEYVMAEARLAGGTARLKLELSAQQDLTI